MERKIKKYRVYELDFGDTNLLSEDIKTITEWIETDMSDLKEGGQLEYTISVNMMTCKQINAIPEWT